MTTGVCPDCRDVLLFCAVSALIVELSLQFRGAVVTVFDSELFRLSGIWNF